MWPGIATEALTCTALEWQASQGGGRIIEDDGAISVNNRKAIGAWQRAARWVGTISPPSVIAFNEFDASNLWFQGKAAFFVIGPRPTMTPKSRVLSLHIRSESPPCRLVRAAMLELWEESGWQSRATRTTKRKPSNWSAFSRVRIWL